MIVIDRIDSKNESELELRSNAKKSKNLGNLN